MTIFLIILCAVMPAVMLVLAPAALVLGEAIILIVPIAIIGIMLAIDIADIIDMISRKIKDRKEAKIASERG